MFERRRCSFKDAVISEQLMQAAEEYYQVVSNAGMVIIFGGDPSIVRNGNIIGAFGANSGTVEQDIAVAEAVIAVLPV